MHLAVCAIEEINKDNLSVAFLDKLPAISWTCNIYDWNIILFWTNSQSKTEQKTVSQKSLIDYPQKGNIYAYLSV